MNRTQTSPSLSKPLGLTADRLQSRQGQVVIIDVRNWLEYLLGHIPGARCLSQTQILKDIPKHQPVVLTCLSGHRSITTAQWLVKQGYDQVYNLSGGVMTWQRLGYPLQRGIRP